MEHRPPCQMIIPVPCTSAVRRFHYPPDFQVWGLGPSRPSRPKACASSAQSSMPSGKPIRVASQWVASDGRRCRAGGGPIWGGGLETCRRVQEGGGNWGPGIEGKKKQQQSMRQIKHHKQTDWAVPRRLLLAIWEQALGAVQSESIHFCEHHLWHDFNQQFGPVPTDIQILEMKSSGENKKTSALCNPHENRHP